MNDSCVMLVGINRSCCSSSEVVGVKSLLVSFSPCCLRLVWSVKAPFACSHCAATDMHFSLV